MDVSDFFFCSGEGKGESVAPGRGGDRFSTENPRGGGFSHERGVGGAGRVSEGNFGGELSIFFRGRNAHQVKRVSPHHCGSRRHTL